MSWTSNFKADPLAEIARWSDMRWPWALIIVFSCALVVLAHNVFQVWLYMKPCEQCVYIRFGFLVIALGGLITIINPKSLIFKLVGAVVGLYGCIYGLMCSIKLSSIHHAIHGDDMDAVFGKQAARSSRTTRSAFRLKSGLRTGSCPRATAATTRSSCPTASCSPTPSASASTCTTAQTAGTSSPHGSS